MTTALIVDDSRLARHMLKQQLAQHGVAADTAQSAEAALDYLKDHRPDVVFLDHLMPGMDGFEALGAIKANPRTATIPVMMYTSQEGELYLGQARALGALGVLPKSLEPADVSKVLKNLHLAPGNPDAGGPKAAAAEAPSPLDVRRLEELIELLFYQHGNALRADLSREIKQLLAAASPPPVPAAPPRRTRRKFARTLGLAATLLLSVAVLALGFRLLATTRLLAQLDQRFEPLLAKVTELEAASTSNVSRTAAPPAAPPQEIDWRLRTGGQFAFGSVPLDDARAEEFDVLFRQLAQARFAGTVRIDVHVGRFCMNYGSDGNLELAPPDQPATSCEQVGWPEIEATALGNRQSPAFANTIASAEIENPGLRVETVSHGSSEPEVGYPPPRYDVTAGDWNTIAGDNQRIGVRLIADTTGPTRLSAARPSLSWNR